MKLRGEEVYGPDVPPELWEKIYPLPKVKLRVDIDPWYEQKQKEMADDARFWIDCPAY